MTDEDGWLQGQQLLELLAVISSYPDEESAVRGAVERAAQALEAEVAAVVIGDRVVASVGYPAGLVPEDDLVAVTRREQDKLDVPGVGECPTVAARWGGTHPGSLLLARWDEGFSIQEQSLVRGMARLLELTLTMLRALERSERQAAENAELLRSLRQRQRLVEHLFDIQRAISRRRPLAQILDMITGAAQDLLGDEIVGLWLRESPDGEDTKLVAHVGLRTEVARRRPTVPLIEAGSAGQAMLTDDVVVFHGYAETSSLIAELADGRLCASMAAPVHDSGTVTGSLMVGSHRQTRAYTASDVQTLRAFAEHVSLALTDANTVDRMYQAFHDSLTGLASRGLFLEQLTKRLGAAEHEAKRVALLFLDLDRFKAVNDSLGHAAGDDLLTITAGRLKSQLRATDVAARFGGDEFAVLLYGVGTAADAARVAERILRTLGEPMPIAGRQLRVNASIGIALSTPGMPDPADLMRRADVAMYQAKRNGRGRLEVFTDEMLLSFPTSD
ncbi:sensor domain-containing diguanylate cyclase [Kibdelosporangium philippinense]|uniref:Sensor domain-containing diguanylate cyclase n=1 Tax=Kibdelosporangium philippinense TaxID=211113 RepID=A0ABS8ZSD6_9PSEU|nr:sensor domain-containing diguanylate cyclase [Kibdelosporangium philippinense]MCE7010635.1 sensor domain-containing diguanylate cyclase [Kibdelosporangium philippinense]